MIINRAWAMPSKDTFRIKPIYELISRHISNGVNVDPFVRNSPFKNDCDWTNDLDPNIKADTFDIIGYTETFTEEYIPCAIIFYERSKGYDGKKAIDQFLSPPIIMSGFRLLWNEVTQNREEFIKRLEKHEL